MKRLSPAGGGFFSLIKAWVRVNFEIPDGIAVKHDLVESTEVKDGYIVGTLNCSNCKEQQVMIDKVYRYMKSCHMIPPGRRILVAVSGGADSMCLLELLRKLQERAQLEIRVLHVHHGLRESAEDDLQYVAEYCKEAGIPFQAVRVDAAGYAAANGLSVEEAARHLRYEALEKAAKEWDRQSDHSECRIAVAHHIEDQSETVLFNLVRGSRLTGLRGMLPVNGRIIRPLLCCSREEIESYLMEHGITWREDETNEDVRYSRNLIRKQVMPLLLSINRGAREHIKRAAEEAAETESYLAGETERALKRCCIQGRYTKQVEGSVQGGYSKQVEIGVYNFDGKQSRGIVIHIPSLLEEPLLLQRRVVYAAIAEASGRKKDLQDVHVQAVLELCRKQGNGELDVAGGVHVTKVYERLYLSPGTGTKVIQPEAKAGQQSALKSLSETKGSRQESQSTWLTDDPFTKLPTEPEAYTCRVFDFDGDMDAVPRKQYTKWLDYDKIGKLPIFRTRRTGDCITLDEYGRTKSIARYMIDRKVPAQIRDRIVMPTCGSEILWVPGGRISAAYMVSTDTKRILEIHWKPAGKIVH